MAGGGLRRPNDLGFGVFAQNLQRELAAARLDLDSDFSTVALFGDSFEFPVRPGTESPGEKQRSAILELAGKWVDSRPLEATIADIEGARTPGREVSL